jgi:hypothetical protein
MEHNGTDQKVVKEIETTGDPEEDGRICPEIERE